VATHVKYELSVTELPHFERLVEFLADVDDHAHREVDLDLKGLVESCRDDLLTLPRTRER